MNLSKSVLSTDQSSGYLRPLVEAELVARSDPEHPNSLQRKYVLTKADEYADVFRLCKQRGG